MKHIAIALILVACLRSAIAAGDAKSFRIIPVPQREHGYRGITPAVIRSKDEFDAFIKTTREQNGWKNRDGFITALTNAAIDFDKEALVLIRHTEGSGSTQVSIDSTELQGRKLVCQLHRKTAQIGTTDMAFHCFAMAVLVADVDEVELQKPNGPPVRIAVKK